MEPASQLNKKQRGFAAMDPEKQRTIARKGGQVAHEKGVAHRWTPDEARDAGRKGGLKRIRDQYSGNDRPSL